MAFGSTKLFLINNLTGRIKRLKQMVPCIAQLIMGRYYYFRAKVRNLPSQLVCFCIQVPKLFDIFLQTLNSAFDTRLIKHLGYA